MSKSKKKVLAIALAVCLLAIMSFSTLAWFNASAEVTNKFQVATSTDDTVFDIIVEEKETPDDGSDEWDTDDWDDDGITYDKIAPGDELGKNVRITNTGAYDQWVRVKVTVTNYTAWQQIIAKANASDFDGYMINNVLKIHKDQLEKQSNGKLVKEVVVDTANNTITYGFYYNAKLTSGSNFLLMDTVSIPTVMDQNDAAAFEGSVENPDGTTGTENRFDITVVAQAIQSDNVTAKVDPTDTTENEKASVAFQSVGWTIAVDKPTVY